MKTTTIKQLRDSSPWEIAEQLGVRYTGDMNPIPHGGCFYSVHNWEQGYAEGVRFQESEGTLWVESVTINKKELGPALKSLDIFEHQPITKELEIEAVLSYWGAEVDSSTVYASDNGKDWGEFPEFQIWKAARPLIIALAE